MTRLLCILILLCACAARATTVITNLADCQYTTINAAVNGANPANTTIINVPTGTATWPASITLRSAGVILQGAGRSNTIITLSGGVHAIDINPTQAELNIGAPFYVKGFTFDGNNSSLEFINISGAATNGPVALTNLAIGNCTFQNAGATASGGAIYSTGGQVRGCIYSNYFINCDVLFRPLGCSGNNSINQFYSHAYPMNLGTADNLYFENNRIWWTHAYTDATGFIGWIESGQGGRVCVRYNYFDFANTTGNQNNGAPDAFDCHGWQHFNGPGSENNGQEGTMIAEYYGNIITNFSGGELMFDRGGKMMFFDNLCYGTGGATINIGDMGTNSSSPYGCNPLVPGAVANNVNTDITNTYFFNNPRNGSQNNAVYTSGWSPSDPSTQCGVAENVNWFNYNSSFNGTAGIGVGTTPPVGTCSPGVGYYVASSTAPTVDPSIIQNSSFYVATATNTWTLFYTPFTYPNPMAITSTTSAPITTGFPFWLSQSPTNFHVVAR